MSVLNRLFFVSPLCLLVVAAHAQVATATSETQETLKVTQERHRQPILISLYTGTNFTRSSDVHLSQPSLGTDVTIENLRWKARSFQASAYYGYKIGTFFEKNPRIGIDLEFNHAKAYGDIGQRKRFKGTWQGQPIDEVALVSDRVQEFRITNGVNTVGINLSYRWSMLRSEKFPEGRLQPYILGGPRYFILYAINNIDHERNEPQGYRNSGFGYQLGAGLRYGLNNKFSVFVESKYIRGDANKVQISDGEAYTDLQMTHLVGGISYAL